VGGGSGGGKLNADQVVETYSDVLDLGDPITQTWSLELPLVMHNGSVFKYSAQKLSGTCAESINLRKEFSKTSKGATLTAAWRIQNKKLLQDFRAYHKLLREIIKLDADSSGFGPGFFPQPRLQLGYHGTRSAESIHSILQDGYDVIYSSNGINAYGHGVYHAKNARTSHQYACKTPLEMQEKMHPDSYSMLMNILVVGDVVKGEAQQIKPPINPNSKHGRRYDTFANDDNADASIIVTTNNAQAYPAYLLNYTL
jgi:hypothetical protein